MGAANWFLGLVAPVSQFLELVAPLPSTPACTRNTYPAAGKVQHTLYPENYADSLYFAMFRCGLVPIIIAISFTVPQPRSSIH